MTSFFVIAATVYLMIAGKPVDPAGEKQYLQIKFQTMEECKALLDSAQFPGYRAVLAAMYRNKIPENGSIAITAVCEPAKAKAADDGSL